MEESKIALKYAFREQFSKEPREKVNGFCEVSG
ncbi:hypothetical protein HNQ80_004298 [Anaerosolibacter carboniphilus]|uniref:Uncharacterized protein n=1 Tax=Anaerosolibacter carboniphilus TaxID=1417629 RepID=A0A841L0P8_9FIRM|nr:hypothetical protein [Anaerosolibacter carboniphilus]